MQSEEVRYKGSRKDQGKIIKGTIKQAPLKLKASSIPSKTQNIVYNNHHQSAFGNSQERFYVPDNQKTYSTPGPGNYQPAIQTNRIQSKRGSGNFASLTKLQRFNDKRNWNPGPGRYESTLSKSRRTKSTYQFSNTSQTRQLFKHEVRVASSIPSPGDYEQQMRGNIMAHNSVFKSNINRFRMKSVDNPPIGYYRWEEIKRKVPVYKFGENQSSKKKDKSVSMHSHHIQNLIGKKLQGFQDLGPGKYTLNLPQSSKGFTIRENNIDRFGFVKEKPKIDENKIETNHTTVIPNENQPKIIRANAHQSVFKSKTRRYQFGERQKEIIGDPGIYAPKKLDRQSHIINFAQKWI